MKFNDIYFNNVIFGRYQYIFLFNVMQICILLLKYTNRTCFTWPINHYIPKFLFEFIIFQDVIYSSHNFQFKNLIIERNPKSPLFQLYVCQWKPATNCLTHIERKLLYPSILSQDSCLNVTINKYLIKLIWCGITVIVRKDWI